MVSQSRGADVTLEGQVSSAKEEEAKRKNKAKKMARRRRETQKLSFQRKAMELEINKRPVTGLLWPLPGFHGTELSQSQWGGRGNPHTGENSSFL